jgi:hypothetical protein
MDKNKLAILSVCYILSGCSMSIKDTDPLVNDKPQERITTLSEALVCAHKAISESKDRNFGYYFIVDDIKDGTIPSEASNGELSDSLKYEFIHDLKQMVFEGYGSVLSNYPIIFKDKVDKDSDFGLNQFGEADKEQIKKLSEHLVLQNNITRANAIAKGEKISPYVDMKPVIVKGAFTRNDENPVRKIEGQLTASAEGFANASLDSSGSHQIKSVSLSILVEDPLNNIVKHSFSWTINTHEKGYSIKFDAGYGDAALNASFDNLTVESKQGAQQALTDAAALWLVKQTYGSVADIDGCMNLARNNNVKK